MAYCELVGSAGARQFQVCSNTFKMISESIQVHLSGKVHLVHMLRDGMVGNPEHHGETTGGPTIKSQEFNIRQCPW